VNAQSIREFIDTLFISRLTLQLREDLAELRADRDYFKGRAERLELMLLEAQRPVRFNTAPPGTPLVGRKSWSQIQAEAYQKIAEEEKAEKEKNNGVHKQA
jgi:hypothetical protein